MADELGFPRSEIGAIMFIGGMLGASFGLLTQYYLNGVDYPLNVAGKPFFSWPMFIPITWELLVLTASLTGLFGLLALCGLPQPYHPVFNVPQFARATKDRFFLVIEATDPQFDLNRVGPVLLGGKEARDLGEDLKTTMEGMLKQYEMPATEKLNAALAKALKDGRGGLSAATLLKLNLPQKK